MRLIQELQQEHELIDAALGALRAWIGERAAGRAEAADGAAFVRFFRLYAGQRHHAREEDLLFPALVKALGVRGDRGPVGVLLDEHHAMAAHFGRLAPLLEAPDWSPGQAAEAATLAREYSHALWRHIDAENSVLLPESEARLVRAGVLELPTPELAPEEEEARAEGVRLVAAWPAAHDPTAFRGDGCVMCAAYGTDRCDGLEREWWNESEWEEAPERFG